MPSCLLPRLDETLGATGSPIYLQAVMELCHPWSRVWAELPMCLQRGSLQLQATENRRNCLWAGAAAHEHALESPRAARRQFPPSREGAKSAEHPRTLKLSLIHISEPTRPEPI
eukprot:1126340-Pyramimonas_sp.AAC.1